MSPTAVQYVVTPTPPVPPHVPAAVPSAPHAVHGAPHAQHAQRQGLPPTLDTPLLL